MQTLQVQVKITKQVITPQDRYDLCQTIIKQIMFPTQTIEAPYVPQVSQQRTHQAYTRTTTIQRSHTHTKQKALVEAYA